jgi:hypothetical protein
MATSNILSPNVVTHAITMVSRSDGRPFEYDRASVPGKVHHDSGWQGHEQRRRQYRQLTAGSRVGHGWATPTLPRWLGHDRHQPTRPLRWDIFASRLPRRASGTRPRRLFRGRQSGRTPIPSLLPCTIRRSTGAAATSAGLRPNWFPMPGEGRPRRTRPARRLNEYPDAR